MVEWSHSTGLAILLERLNLWEWFRTAGIDQSEVTNKTRVPRPIQRSGKISVWHTCPLQQKNQLLGLALLVKMQNS